MVYVTNQLGKKYSFEDYKDILMNGNNDVVFNFPSLNPIVRRNVTSLVLINEENPEECLLAKVKLATNEMVFCELASKDFVDCRDDRKNTVYFLLNKDAVGYLSFGALKEEVQKAAKRVISGEKQFAIVREKIEI